MYMRGMTGKWNAMWHSSEFPKYGAHVTRPLVRLGEKDPVREFRVERGAKPAQDVVRLRQILAVRSLALDRDTESRRAEVRRRRGAARSA